MNQNKVIFTNGVAIRLTASASLLTKVGGNPARPKFEQRTPKTHRKFEVDLPVGMTYSGYLSWKNNHRAELEKAKKDLLKLAEPVEPVMTTEVQVGRHDKVVSGGAVALIIIATSVSLYTKVNVRRKALRKKRKHNAPRITVRKK